MRRIVVVAIACALGLPGVASAKPKPPKPATYLVGMADRAINPDADGTFAGKPVYLGGFGIGGGSPVFQGRPATGVLGDGIHVRAVAISDGRHPLAVADVETQGWFVANKDAPDGLVDMRKAVAERTGGRLPAESVVVQSDHTHSGPDPLGVWGGIPLEYRKLIFDRTVDAIVAAYESMRPATLWYGVADGTDLLSNQFDYDEANKGVDGEVRVLQARDPKRGTALGTLLDFSAHATVLGSSNTKVSGDWVQAANPLLAQRFGGQAVTLVGTVGRTQPADRSCPDPTATTADAQNLCKIDHYAGRVVDRAAQAVAAARPLTGDPTTAARSYLLEDPSSNALILGFEYVGGAIGIPLNRAMTPPWLTGNVLGTVAATARIGDLLLLSGPGEMYPQIPQRIREMVGADAGGFMTAGLANDQLGYLIAPYQAYPEPIRRSFFNQQGDEVSPIDNDNYFFNVSHTMGERLGCAFLRGAGEVLGKGTAYRDADPGCLPFANDAALPDGADVSGAVP
jgi:hypothetical protein